jgi:hypothetical protein
MKNNKKTTIIIIIVALLLIGFYIKMADFSSPKIDDDKFYKKITELELKIDSLNYQKDSIRTVIDSTHIKIVTNEKHYQERVNTIITQPDSFSESFTRQYILEYATNHGYHILGASEIE